MKQNILYLSTSVDNAPLAPKGILKLRTTEREVRVRSIDTNTRVVPRPPSGPRNNDGQSRPSCTCTSGPSSPWGMMRIIHAQPQALGLRENCVGLAEPLPASPIICLLVPMPFVGFSPHPCKPAEKTCETLHSPQWPESASHTSGTYNLSRGPCGIPRLLRLG